MTHPDQQYSDDQLRYTVERIVRDGIGLGGTYSWTGPTNRILELIAAREQRLLDRIGEPTLESFPYTPTPEEYKKMCDVIKWYKDRIAAIRSKL